MKKKSKRKKEKKKKKRKNDVRTYNSGQLKRLATIVYTNGPTLKRKLESCCGGQLFIGMKIIHSFSSSRPATTLNLIRSLTIRYKMP